ncbi:redoxin family protein [Rheinheimera sp. F8]|uniref:TlpA family protein disulfide reductase n=1 Tax=Rheinheimera sp. F8 TaxID=1763998 RepID=UPI000AB0C999|nr:redoxin family protein [Rheinheimera sp. F8]
MLKYIALLLLCLSTLCRPALAQQPVGKVLDQLQLQRFPALQPFTVKDLDPAKPTYLKLWASWCKPCLEQMPHFQQLQQTYGDKINFVAVNININENRQDIRQVIQRFGLTMPVVLDQQGQLGVALGLVGTPYSVLLDPQQQMVFSSHESDAALDGFLQRLAQGQTLAPAAATVLSSAQQQQLLAPFAQGEHLLFFTATWCDWYLADSRPAMAAQCKSVQSGLNALTALLPDQHWVGVVNHLWTDEKALADFRTLYQLKIPLQIDSYGVMFQHFNVRNIPLLLKIKDGKIVAEIRDFSDPAAVIRQLK